MTNMKTLSVKKCVSFGWKTFWSRPWLFVAAGVIVFLVNVAISVPQSFIDRLSETAQGTPDGMGLALAAFTISVVGGVLSVFLQMGTTRFFLKAHDTTSDTRLHDLIYLRTFWRYVGASILVFFAVLLGFLLLIVPGIIASIALSFALYLVIDKGLGPVEAFKQSLALTKGHRWSLFFLALATLGLNILGLLALVVGLLISIPVSMLAMMHAYRLLSVVDTDTEATSEDVESIPVAA